MNGMTLKRNRLPARNVIRQPQARNRSGDDASAGKNAD